MEEEFLHNENQKRLDLFLENKSFQNELFLKTGVEIQPSEDGDPFMHNQFLKSVLTYEEADKEPEVLISSLFPDCSEFPDEKMLSDVQIVQKLDEIYKTLSAYNIEFGFSEELPDRVLYKHLTEEVIPEDTIHASTQAGFTCVLDGCSGNCPDCFQKDYCKIGMEYEDNDEESKG